MKVYFEKFASGVPEQLEQAAALAAPNSYAYGYAAHRANLAGALVDNGQEMPSDVVEFSEGVAKVCDTGGSSCSDFSDFTFNDGKLAGFTIDGVEISDRLVLGDGSVVKSKGVAGFELLSMYQAVSDGSLIAVVRFHSYARPINTSYIATYRDPTGKQVEDGGQSVLPSTIAPDSNQVGVAVFPRAEVGGQLILKFATDDEQEPLIVEEVPVKTAPAKAAAFGA